MSKTIKLTQGKVAIVDDEDFDRINAHKWYALKKKTGKFYAVRHVLVWGFRRLAYMHREVLNAASSVEVDHIRSDDTLDNRRNNLRPCTHAQNVKNSGIDKNNTSGFKGVSWDCKNGKWQVRIGINNRNIHIGYFVNIEAAARAYDEAARKYHGEFARTNFS